MKNPDCACVVGLDLGTTTGWAVLRTEKPRRTAPRAFTRGAITASGIFTLAPRRGDSPGMRYVYLRAKLEALFASLSTITLVCYEQAHHRGGAATEIAAGLAATVQAFCAERKIQHTTVHTSTLKKHATGDGRAKKPAMIRAANATLRVISKEIEDDNEADAVLCAKFGADLLHGRE